MDQGDQKLKLRKYIVNDELADDSVSDLDFGVCEEEE